MTAPAREQLVVYWDGEEVAGLIVFALRSKEAALGRLQFGSTPRGLTTLNVIIVEAQHRRSNGEGV